MHCWEITAHHKAKVKDGEATIRGADEVPRVRVSMEEAMLKELLQKADDANIDERPDVVCLALAQLLSIQPTRGQDLAGGQL